MSIHVIEVRLQVLADLSVTGGVDLEQVDGFSRESGLMEGPDGLEALRIYEDDVIDPLHASTTIAICILSVVRIDGGGDLAGDLHILQFATVLEPKIRQHRDGVLRHVVPFWVVGAWAYSRGGTK
jgi:hypothetical protein